METKEDKIQQKISKNSATKFYCNFCDYGTCRKSNFDTHILSAKHQRITKEDKGGQNSAKIQQNFSKNLNKEKFTCSCGKEYQHRQGL
jgi:hypothetical protein